MKKRISFGEYIRNLRDDKGFPLREIAEILKIDISTLSKIERNERYANKEMIEKLAKIFSVSEKELLISFLSDRLAYEIVDEDLAIEVLKVAEQKVEYMKKSNGI